MTVAQIHAQRKGFVVAITGTIAPNTDAEKALLRAARIPAVMLAIYRAAKCSDQAQVSDIPDDQRTALRQAAEAAVQFYAEPALVEAADYFAAEHLHGDWQAGAVFGDLSLKQRYHYVLGIRLALRRWFGFVRAEWPQAIPRYAEMAATDKAEILACNQARRFAVMQGGSR